MLTGGPILKINSDECSIDLKIVYRPIINRYANASSSSRDPVLLIACTQRYPRVLYLESHRDTQTPMSIIVWVYLNSGVKSLEL